jgi:hypothetical protein
MRSAILFLFLLVFCACAAPDNGELDLGALTSSLDFTGWDRFERTVADGWGSSSDGLSWSLREFTAGGPTSPTANVGDGVGRTRQVSGESVIHAITVGGKSKFTDTDVSATFRWVGRGTGWTGEQTAGVVVRDSDGSMQDPGEWVFTELASRAGNPKAQFQIQHKVGGVKYWPRCDRGEGNQQTEITNDAISSGRAVRVRVKSMTDANGFLRVGTKVWFADAGGEPTEWLQDCTFDKRGEPGILADGSASLLTTDLGSGRAMVYEVDDVKFSY